MFETDYYFQAAIYTSDVRLNCFITFKNKFAEACIANCEIARH